MEHSGRTGFERGANPMNEKTTMISTKKNEEILSLLLELHSLLKERSEANWIRGIQAAINEIACGDGRSNESGFQNARSIYKTMNEGGRGFAEYFIWQDNEVARIVANRDLDNIRARLWVAFEL